MFYSGFHDFHLEYTPLIHLLEYSEHCKVPFVGDAQGSHLLAGRLAGYSPARHYTTPTPVYLCIRPGFVTLSAQREVCGLYKAVEKEVAKDVGTKRAYNCSKCKQPKKKSCICKTASQAVEKIADAPDEAVEASVQATGSTGIPVKKRKRSPSADGRRTRSKIKA